MLNLKEERHQFILNKIKQSKSVSVKELSEEMHVVPMTIRRDLKELEQKSLLVRVHGGAVDSSTFYNELANEEKQQLNSENKRVIAEKASRLIQNGDIIFIGSGTTNEAIYQYIKEMKLHIITNSLYIFEQYKDIENMDVVLIGGRYRKKTGSFIGHLAISMLKNLHIDKAFIGVNGIIDDEATTANEEEGNANELILSQSTEKYLVSDSSKFNTRAFTPFYKVRDLDAIITDSAISSEVEDYYSKLTKIL
ncbi:DeoR/GlpR transcriptional regulator [Staphylococcus condimenti]|uniref:Lactose phosphotransferase system repressor n=1 Tax=Staphylococcus condimenti TaxID=70255 RepID=A0AB37HC97_9STAP|nr:MULTISPECIES: DeoR/GlpR family DNA-binding transcription regulator [Staphylococcus]AMY05202.1 DeoR family transcriptional regulator [Staphylococcus condimenti]APR61395.1 DeoR family transcriptional regulator [Staphylococcus condimenti]MDK8646399.1 DeoR/GlpR family DNA-binding transcription regulator [Staphylococcus condimenti]OFO98653.1 DeoR family transcriptional regulator [Staphylococcus sp. HMSC065E08]PNZ60134.1 DeoR/GlpR transcriptional regulator [Staphylococcus condimenti]